MKSSFLPLFLLPLLAAACSRSAAPAAPLPTPVPSPVVEEKELLLTEQEKADIKPLVNAYYTKQLEATDAQQRFRGAEDVLKAEHKLGDAWQDAPDGLGSIKFIKPPGPRPSPSSGGSPQPAATPEEFILRQNEKEYLKPLIDTVIQKQLANREATLELKGALGLLKKQHKLDDAWQDAPDGSGSFKFIKKPAPSPSPTLGAASSPTASPAK